VPLFLVSLKAGALAEPDRGRLRVPARPWWNPAVEAQAIDRAHRIGQERPVFAYRLIAADTVEERIIELQARKRQLADAIISADNSGLAGLTARISSCCWGDQFRIRVRDSGLGGSSAGRVAREASDLAKVVSASLEAGRHPGNPAGAGITPGRARNHASGRAHGQRCTGAQAVVAPQSRVG